MVSRSLVWIETPYFKPQYVHTSLSWIILLTPGYVLGVWAPPGCTQCSIARSTAKVPTDLIYADRIVQRALEIIRYHNPRAWLLENPASSLWETREFMYILPCVTVSYCKYMAGYQKHTMLWGTVIHHKWRPKCHRDCELQAPGMGAARRSRQLE